jgi:PhnB protein
MATSLWPHLSVHDGPAAVAFYEKALGAKAEMVMPAGDGRKLMHAGMKVGDVAFMLCDDFPEHCGGVSRAPKTTGAASPVALHLTVEDCDAAMAKMAAAGGTVSMPAMDAFWGSRYGRVTDPFGHEWSFAHPLPADRAKAAAEAWQAWKATGA